MFTSDIALKADPAYNAISTRFHENPDQFADAFAKAWYKLTHRDMGPVDRYLGSEVPAEPQLWQDPLPAPTGIPMAAAEIHELKAKILASGLSTGQLVSAAWASASTFRGTDKRGGANGARLRLAPQNTWAVNVASGTAETIEALEAIRTELSAAGGAGVSIADLIVLGGCAAVEEAAKAAGHPVEVPFAPGRTDAAQDQTDVASFAVLEPVADWFRNHAGDGASPVSVEEQLVERAQLLTLTAPEMAVLVGGLRVLGANAAGSDVGVLTSAPGTLTNDFFVNLLDNDTVWSGKDGSDQIFEGRGGRGAGDVRFTGSRADLIFGSNSQLRAVAENYACDDSKAAFAADFAAAWSKVMHLDRFDLA